MLQYCPTPTLNGNKVEYMKDERRLEIALYKYDAIRPHVDIVVSFETETKEGDGKQ